MAVGEEAEVPIATRVVGIADKPTVGTPLGVATQRRRAARFDRRHDATFGTAEVASVGLPICCAVAAEDVRQP